MQALCHEEDIAGLVVSWPTLLILLFCWIVLVTMADYSYYAHRYSGDEANGALVGSSGIGTPNGGVAGPLARLGT